MFKCNLGSKICHQKCRKFQEFLLDDFGRLFKMYSEMCKKESETNNRLVIALERNDEMEVEVKKLHEQLSEYDLY